MKKNVANQGRQCSFEVCENPARYKKLCNGHYVQKQRGKELTQLKPGKRKYGRVCKFKGCRLQHYAKGYCNGHFQQLKRGEEVIPLQGRNPHGQALVVCVNCGAAKTAAEFSASARDGIQTRCKECDRWLNMKANNNLTREQWLGMFESQDKRCAVCGTGVPGSKNGWQVDHDHTCCPGKKSCGQCVRGIVCKLCVTRAELSNDPLYAEYRDRNKTAS